MDKYKILKEQIKRYVPYNEQEANDKALILKAMENEYNLLNRENKTAHFTVSAWVANKKHDKVLMAYHNIYDSWAWLGGHADGEADLKAVAAREVCEESGLEHFEFASEDIFSLEILTVDGHEKRGKYVSSHLHYNITFLIEADEKLPVRIKADENSLIGWIPVCDISVKSTEKWFIDRIYSKLCEKMKEA